MLSWLFRKKENVYSNDLHFEQSVVLGFPERTKKLAPDMMMELYLADPGWAIAVIAVRNGAQVYRMKHDSGRVNEDLGVMMKEVLSGLKHYNLDTFRRMAAEKLA